MERAARGMVMNSATILTLPVIRKRGRKVSKGPKASVSVIYEGQKGQGRQAGNGLDEALEEFARLIAKNKLQKMRERRDYESWLDASPTVRRFPECRRFRTLDQVDNLKAGKHAIASPDDCDDGTSLGRAVSSLAERAMKRADEILAEMELAESEA